jgi:hypothetical protein
LPNFELKPYPLHHVLLARFLLPLFTDREREEGQVNDLYGLPV